MDEEKKMLDGYEVVVRTMDKEMARKVKKHIEFKFGLMSVDIKRSYLTEVGNNKLKMVKEDVEKKEVKI